jgi:CHAT domain-containing protein
MTQQKTWLIQEYSIAYSPSISAYQAILARKQTNGTKRSMHLLAFGDPDFGRLEAQDNSADTSNNSSNGNSHALYRLKYSGTEIDKISRLFKNTKTTAFVRDEASEEKLKKHQLDDYKIIHFATHSQIDNKWPMRSHIVLSINESPEENGFLEAREIYNLNLNADLITLSACESGLGKFIRGEGIEGLNRAFFYAGASSVLMSLWPVNDQATYQLMERFYTYLKASESIMNSLRKAKLEMINSGVLSHPYYWAGFVISGKADHIIFQRDYKRWFLLCAILLASVVIITAFVRRKRSSF